MNDDVINREIINLAFCDRQGDIEASESVGGMLRVMDSLTEKQNGAFLNYKGVPLSW